VVILLMLQVEQALNLVAKHAVPLAPQRLPLRDAAGLLLADDITSEVDSPPYSKALMDGYAVRSADRQPERRILEEVAAGAVPRHQVVPGTAVRIMTGAPIPEGADAVVPIEQSELVDATMVRLHQVDPACGKNVLPRGASMRAGDVVLHRGTLLRPIEIAILAETGHAAISVQPRPRVAVLPTGNEIVPVGEQPGPGQIRNSNGPMLLAAASRAGAQPVELGIARDDRDALKHSIEAGLAADVLVLSGGVSAGAFDLVPGVLAELGVEQVFHKIDLRPGKPLWFGVKRTTSTNVLVFGLPGNPVSSLVCFELFVRPAIAALSGRGFVGLRKIPAKLVHDFAHAGGRVACLPARAHFALNETLSSDGRLHDDTSPQNSQAVPIVEILPWQGSADIATLARANVLAQFPSEKLHYLAGTLIDVLLL
jgi:molybdopterin molybdotransferase